jgi:hypothetical protein
MPRRRENPEVIIGNAPVSASSADSRRAAPVGRTISCVALLCILAVPFLALPRDTKSAESFFPLVEGAYWVYGGSVTWFNQDKQADVQATVSLKMSVEKVYRKENAIFAVLEGFPSDLNFSDGEVKRSQWVLIEKQNGKQRVFLHELDSTMPLPTAQNPGNAFDSFMTDDDLLFEWPMTRRDKFCDPDARKREDDMYCWMVESDEKTPLRSINGLASAKVPVYTLTYRTNPDDTQMEVSPGIGIVAYHYHHHGTTADTDLKLLEFHPAAEKSLSTGATP